MRKPVGEGPALRGGWGGRWATRLWEDKEVTWCDNLLDQVWCAPGQREEQDGAGGRGAQEAEDGDGQPCRQRQGACWGRKGEGEKEPSAAQSPSCPTSPGMLFCNHSYPSLPDLPLGSSLAGQSSPCWQGWRPGFQRAELTCRKFPGFLLETHSTSYFPAVPS